MSGPRVPEAQQNQQFPKFIRSERLIGYGHIVSDDASQTLATTWFVQLENRAAAEAFIVDDPLNRAGVYEKTDIRRWSNSQDDSRIYRWEFGD